MACAIHTHDHTAPSIRARGLTTIERLTRTVPRLSQYWVEDHGQFVVASSYVTVAFEAALAVKGITKSLAEASKGVTIPTDGDGPIASVVKDGTPTFIEDAPTSQLSRNGLLSSYGVHSVILEPVEGGVLEFGNSDGLGLAAWTGLPQCPDVPQAELRTGFAAGAVNTMFWALEGEDYVIKADYVLPERQSALKKHRSDDKTFTSESRHMKLSALGDGSVATAARSGKTIVVGPEQLHVRKTTALEFGIHTLTFVPCVGGVLEYDIAPVTEESRPESEPELPMNESASQATGEQTHAVRPTTPPKSPPANLRMDAHPKKDVVAVPEGYVQVEPQSTEHDAAMLMARPAHKSMRDKWLRPSKSQKNGSHGEQDRRPSLAVKEGCSRHIDPRRPSLLSGLAGRADRRGSVGRAKAESCTAHRHALHGHHGQQHGDCDANGGQGKQSISVGSRRGGTAANSVSALTGVAKAADMGKVTRDERIEDFGEVLKQSFRYDLDDLNGEVVRLCWGQAAETLDTPCRARGTSAASQSATASRTALTRAQGNDTTATLMRYGMQLTNRLVITSHVEGRLNSSLSSPLRRLLQLDGSPFVSAIPPRVSDPVGKDIKDLPSVLANIQTDWDQPVGSLNRMSAWTFTHLLRKRMRAHDNKTHDGSVDVLIAGCEVSLWVGEQFAADLHRVFPKLRIVTYSANKLLGLLGQSFPIAQTNFPFHAGSHNLNQSLCLLVSHSGGTFATLACSNLLRSFTPHIFAVTSEWDTQIARSIRNGTSGGGKKGMQVRSYVFETHVGLRTAEPCTISVAATHQLLTQILLYVMHYLRQYDVRAALHSIRPDRTPLP